jgi:hypothetical protein
MVTVWQSDGGRHAYAVSREREAGPCPGSGRPDDGRGRLVISGPQEVQTAAWLRFHRRALGVTVSRGRIPGRGRRSQATVFL